MATTKAMQKAVGKYMKANYDETKIRYRKDGADGFTKEELQQAAESENMSVNAYIVGAILRRMDTEKNP